MKIPACGFTLVELLVVLAIMAIVGVFTLANYRSFGEDRNLKSAVLDIQSLLKQAQTNASTGTSCSGQYNDVRWCVEFANDKTINLRCSTALNACSTAAIQKSVQLDIRNYINIGINSVSGTGIGCTSGLSFPFTVDFPKLKGNIGFGVANCTSLTITLKNINTQSTKLLKIEQGGRIYGE